MSEEAFRSDGAPCKLEIISAYKRLAAQAYELVPYSSNNDHKNAIIQIAETWLLLADQVSRLPLGYAVRWRRKKSR
jgi:hypothetical protein